MRKRLISLALVVVLSLPLLIAIFRPYIMGTADGIGHRFRLVSFSNSLKEGNLRPKWAKEAALGFGAPTFLFNYPLPYYLASIFHLLGFSINISGQLFSTIVLLLSGIFMYLLVEKLVGHISGVVASAFYIYAPYHLLMVFVYDSWGEQLAFVFPPLILFFMLSLISKNSKKRNNWLHTMIYFLLLTFSWFLFILSHNVSVLMFTPVILILSVVLILNKVGANKQKKAFVLVILSLVFAFLISSFFWLPAWVLKQEIKYPAFIVSEGAIRGAFFKSLKLQLKVALHMLKTTHSSYWDFTFGLPVMLSVLLSLAYLVKAAIKRYQKKLKNLKDTDIVIALLVVFAVLGLFLTDFYTSNFIWKFFPFTYILYPYRFLFLTSFAGAILAGILVSKSKVLAVVFLLLIIAQGIWYKNPKIDTFSFPSNYFENIQTYSSAPLNKKNMLIKEFLPSKAKEDILIEAENEFYSEFFQEIKWKKEEFVFPSELGSVTNLQSLAQKISARLESKTPTQVIVNRFYFPNWSAKVDNQKVSLRSDLDGRMIFDLPQGEHKIELIFRKTKIEKTADIVSLTGLFALFGFVLFYSSKKKRLLR